MIPPLAQMMDRGGWSRRQIDEDEYRRRRDALRAEPPLGLLAANAQAPAPRRARELTALER